MLNEDSESRHFVGKLSGFVGNIYKNYGNEPHVALLMLSCSFMICAHYLIEHTFYIKRVFLFFFDDKNPSVAHNHHH